MESGGSGRRRCRNEVSEKKERGQRTFGLEKVGSGGFSYNGEGGEGMFGNRFAEVRVRTFWLEKVGCGDERPIITVKTADLLHR